MPTHKRGRYVQQDPSGGGQKMFWSLLGCGVLVAIGCVVLYQVFVR